MTPISVQAEDGRSVPQSSILSTRVSLAAHTDQTAMSVVTALVNSLTQATKRKVVVGMVPLNLLAQTRVENAVSGESARSVLERIVRATGRRVSWRLYYDPGLQMYALNLHLIK